MKPPTLHELHAHATHQRDVLKGKLKAAKTITREEALELECATTLPVLLGYLRTVRTGAGAHLSELLVSDSILTPE